MSDEDDISGEERELEAELRRLVPSTLKSDFVDELIRDRERIDSPKPAPSKRSKWMVPTLVTCAVVFGFSTFWKVKKVYPGAEVVETAAPSATSSSDFIPVSSEGYLLNAASGGIIESENGLREQFELNYEDVQQWHNPDTATTIRIFSPRREIVTVPLQTD
ncbi:MAG: hypothetical protein P1U89_08590 [Verrucomicrobiales bacterium]|nr:hypothetical protein [Verrucomicrobiales bacterium]